MKLRSRRAAEEAHLEAERALDRELAEMKYVPPRIPGFWEALGPGLGSLVVFLALVCGAVLLRIALS